MKHYAWIPMKRKAPNLYMFYVGSVNHFALVTDAKFTQIHTTCLPPPDDTKAYPSQYKTKFWLV